MLPLILGLVVFISSPILFSAWWGHVLTATFAAFHIHKISKYCLFWLLLAVILVSSSELRFSLEYFLLASGIFAASLSPKWQKLDLSKKEIFFFVLFLLFFLLDFFKIRLYEKGSMILLLPFTLALLYPLTELHIKNPKANRKQLIVYCLSSIAILLSNKRATLLAFLTSLKQSFNKKILILIAVLILGLSYLVKDNFVRHYQKSIKPRLYIYKSIGKAFINKPLFGHGFGTFALDYPPYRYHADTVGGKDTEYINHGHSQIFHILFENGLAGLIVFGSLLFFIFQQSKLAFWTFLITSLFDMPLKSFGQFLIFGLIINTFNYHVKGKYLNYFLMKINKNSINKISSVLITTVSLIVFSISSFAHYKFDMGLIDEAIKIDKYNSLYHFERGAFLINQNIEQSKTDLENALRLSPSIGYFQAFYSAALLGTGENYKAKMYIDKAIKQMGSDPYLFALASFAYQDDKVLSQNYMGKALELNPDIEYLLKDPSFSADEFIAARQGNPRIMSFYRRGKKLFLPLPYIEE